MYCQKSDGQKGYIPLSNLVVTNTSGSMPEIKLIVDTVPPPCAVGDIVVAFPLKTTDGWVPCLHKGITLYLPETSLGSYSQLKEHITTLAHSAPPLPIQHIPTDKPIPLKPPEKPKSLRAHIIGVPSTVSKASVVGALQSIPGFKSLKFQFETDTHPPVWMAVFEVQDAREFYATHLTITIEGIQYPLRKRRPKKNLVDFYVCNIPEYVDHTAVVTALQLQIPGFRQPLRKHYPICRVKVYTDDAKKLINSHPYVTIEGVSYRTSLQKQKKRQALFPQRVGRTERRSVSRIPPLLPKHHPIPPLLPLPSSSSSSSSSSNTQQYSTNGEVVDGGNTRVIAIALYDYAVDEADKQNRVPLKAKEIVTVAVNDEGSGYTYISKEDGTMGYIPTNYIQILT